MGMEGVRDPRGEVVPACRRPESRNVEVRLLRVAASLGAGADFVEQVKHRVRKPGPLTPIGRARLTRQIVHVPNLFEDQAYLERDPLTVGAVEQGHF